jgi:hypothetical protein
MNFFIHSCLNFTIWHAVLLETWHVLHFCTDGFPRVSRVRRWRYNPYQQVAQGGFSTPCVGSAQCRWLHHPTDLGGVRVWVLECSPLQGNRHCTATPGPRRLVQLELCLLVFYYPRDHWVSCSPSVDRLLWPQPYCGSSLSIRAVPRCESSRPGLAGPYGSPMGAAVASWATACHSDVGSLSSHFRGCVTTPSRLSGSVWR